MADDLLLDLKRWMEVIDWLMFYNHSKSHSTLNYMSPMQFEERWLAEQRKKSA